MSGPAAIAVASLAYFEDVHRQVFAGDPAANPHLRVEIVEPAMADDTPVLLLITPWTLNGMAFPPDGGLPGRLRIGGRSYQVLFNTVDALGTYAAVNLVPDVSGLASQEAARAAARPLAGPFREAVAAARGAARVEDPDRRRLLRGDRG